MSVAVPSVHSSRDNAAAHPYSLSPSPQHNMSSQTHLHVGDTMRLQQQWQGWTSETRFPPCRSNVRCGTGLAATVHSFVFLLQCPCPYHSPCKRVAAALPRDLPGLTRNDQCAICGLEDAGRRQYYIHARSRRRNHLLRPWPSPPPHPHVVEASAGCIRSTR